MSRTFVSALAVALLLVAAPAPLFAADLPAYTPDANADRADVPDAYKWDLTALYPSVDAWEEEIAGLDARLPELAAFKGHLADPARLKGCLDLYFALHDKASRVTQYANLALDTNLTDEERQARSQRGLAAMDRVMAASGFIR